MKFVPPWSERLSKASLSGIAFGLAVGALGGFTANWVAIPLAWMLGSLFFTMGASLAGLPVMVPTWLRLNFVILLGMFLGESFDRLTLEDLSRWPMTLAGAILYVPVGAYAAYAFFRYVAREDRNTAICESVPGGLSAVILLSSAMGADERSVALSQSLRISIVVLLAPVIAFGILDLPHPEHVELPPEAIISLSGFLTLLAGSLAIVWVLNKTGMPMAVLVAPVIASAVLRMSGVVSGALPPWLIEISLVVLGSSIGSRFAGVPLRKWFSIAAMTLVGTLILMAVSALFAVMMAWITGQDLMPLVLAYAPGGVAEMSIIAVAIEADPGFVAVHHIVRIAFILLAFPLFAAWLMRRNARAGALEETET
ncbi:AbrB family transcriptional regulator [Rhodobacteraceae bacterium NNCM2]|nr:AbrB family transcriptional regulator [Coraliihabitans acroporae]